MLKIINAEIWENIAEIWSFPNLFAGGVHIDLRAMNSVGLMSSHMAVLGPGGTWKSVLEKIPPSKYTMIHGQCTSVGVGGYILGGGVNVVGTSERYGSAVQQVERYTMVDAKGRTLLVQLVFFERSGGGNCKAISDGAVASSKVFDFACWKIHNGRCKRKSTTGTISFSSAAEEDIAKQFPTELWRVLKFSILHVVVIIWEVE
jgi:hypothetical protein